MTNSIALKRRWEEPKFRRRMCEVRRRSWMSRDREVIHRRWSEASKKKWSRKDYRKVTIAGIKERATEEYRKTMSETMKRIGHRPQPSLGARRLKRLLGRGWELEYRVKWELAIDIAYPEMKLAIEVDGVTHNYPAQKKRDRLRDTLLRKLGWSVFRVSEVGCRNLSLR